MAPMDHQGRMDRNLYAPPAATVADPAEPRGQRPRAVTWAVIILWLWLAVDIAQSILPVATELINAPFGIVGILLFLAVPIGVPAAFTIWINTSVAHGRNWARILVVIFAVISTGFTVVQAHNLLKMLHDNSNYLYGPFQVAKLGAAIAAVALLFTPRANRWFKPTAWPT